MISVVYGSEDHLLDLAQLEFRSKQRGSVVLDAEDCGVEDIMSVLEEDETPLVVENGQKVRANKTLDRLKTFKPSLLVVCRSEKPGIWAKYAAKQTEHAKAKPWQENEVLARIQTEAKRLGASIDTEGANLLFRYVGNDLRRLSGEIKKMAILGSISKATVIATVSPQFHADPFEVADLVFDRKLKKALALTGTLFDAVGAQTVAPVVTSMCKHAERHFLAKLLLAKGRESEVAARLGLHPFIVQKTFLPRLKLWTEVQLKRAVAITCKLDGAMRHGACSQSRLETSIIRLLED